MLVVTAPDGAVVAWYSEPTTRYAHGALGDDIEGSTLKVELDGVPSSFTTSADAVFEDLAPRFADLDGDGTFEVITIESTSTDGGGIAIFAYRPHPDLLPIARGARIGTPFRWLNVVGAADFDDDGVVEIAYVVRPHLDGTLTFAHLADGALVAEVEEPGYTNHAYGSRLQGQSAVFAHEAAAYAVVPTSGFVSIRVVALRNAGLDVLAEWPLNEPPTTNIASGDGFVAWSDASGVQIIVARD